MAERRVIGAALPLAIDAEPVVAECAGRALVEIDDRPTVLASATVAVAAEADQLAAGQALRDRLDRPNALDFHGADELLDRVERAHAAASASRKSNRPGTARSEAASPQ
jgi:hypothetical protein